MDMREMSDTEVARMREDLEREMEERGKTNGNGDSPKGYGERNGGGRRRKPTEIQGVLFQVRVPVGRRGETMPAYLLFPPVRDERELEDLADEVEREFKLATVYPPKEQRREGGYGSNGYGHGRDRGYDRGRDRDYRR